MSIDIGAVGEASQYILSSQKLVRGKGSRVMDEQKEKAVFLICRNNSVPLSTLCNGNDKAALFGLRMSTTGSLRVACRAGEWLHRYTRKMASLSYLSRPPCCLLRLP